MAGITLERETNRDKQERWSRIEAVRATGHSQSTTASAASACDQAYEFVKSCPAWDPNVKVVQVQVCGIALDEDFQRERARLHASTEMSGFDKPVTSVWPTLNASGAISGAVKGRGFPLSLARVSELKPEESKISTLLRDARVFEHDTLQFERDMTQLTSSCADLDELGRRGTTVADFTADRYVLLKRERREREVSTRQAEIERRVTKPYDVAPATQEAARQQVPPAKALAAEIRCYNVEAAKKADADVTLWATTMETAIAEENKCRATPACMGARIADLLCPVILDRREAAQAMATEKSNPGGVVNLVTLHELGQRIQLDDGNIATLKAEFTSRTHRAFDGGSCPK